MPVSTNLIRSRLKAKEKGSSKITVVISSLHQLAGIIYNHSLINRGTYRVKLAIAGFSRELNVRLERKTNQYLSSCGCSEGTIAGVGLLVLRLVFPFNDGWLFGNAFVDIPVVLIIGAIAGKIFTNLVFRFMLIKQLRRAAATGINSD